MKISMRPATKLPEIIIHRKVAAYCWVSTTVWKRSYTARTPMDRKYKMHCNKNRRTPTSFTGCGFLLWTLPRAKNCSPALNFYTSVRTGAALSSPSFQCTNNKREAIASLLLLVRGLITDLT